MTDDELMDAAYEWAELYKDDDRQDIDVDVINAFMRGATVMREALEKKLVHDKT